MQLRELFSELPGGQDGVIPLALQSLLRSELDVLADWGRAESLLLDARSRFPERLELAVALYKMYAYSNRFDDALIMIQDVLHGAARQGRFDADWRAVQGGDGWAQACGPHRFYLYSLKALGFVLLRKGELEGACEVLDKLCALDPQDQVGGSVVRAMAERVCEV